MRKHLPHWSVCFSRHQYAYVIDQDGDICFVLLLCSSSGWNHWFIALVNGQVHTLFLHLPCVLSICTCSNRRARIHWWHITIPYWMHFRLYRILLSVRSVSAKSWSMVLGLVVYSRLYTDGAISPKRMSYFNTISSTRSYDHLIISQQWAITNT